MLSTLPKPRTCDVLRANFEVKVELPCLWGSAAGSLGIVVSVLAWTEMSAKPPETTPSDAFARPELATRSPTAFCANDRRADSAHR